jgi:hypothetical protein
MEHPEASEASEAPDEFEQTEQAELFQIIYQAYLLYFEHGARSNEKVNYFHREIKRMLERVFTSKEFEVILEYPVPCLNSSGKKRCDIVVLKNKIPYIVFPVKLNMTNVKQNQINSSQNLTGEIQHMRWHNETLPELERLHFIPINIWMDKPPYLIKNSTIKHFESITESDIEDYNHLITHGLCYDVINYIVEVDHIKKVKERFDAIHPIKRMKTKYRTFHSILAKLL